MKNTRKEESSIIASLRDCAGYHSNRLRQSGNLAEKADAALTVGLCHFDIGVQRLYERFLATTATAPARRPDSK